MLSSFLGVLTNANAYFSIELFEDPESIIAVINPNGGIPNCSLCFKACIINDYLSRLFIALITGGSG